MRVELREVLRAALALGALTVSACAPAPGAELAAAEAGQSAVEAEAGGPPPAGLDAGTASARGQEDAARSGLDAARAGLDAAREAATSESPGDAAAASDARIASAALPQALRAAGVQALFPAPGDTEVCPDPALRISFAAPPSLGSRGRVQLFDSARAEMPFATLDLAQPLTTQLVAGASLNVPRAAYVEGNAIVLLLPKPLEYGREYFVRVEAGGLVAPGGMPLTLDDATSWRFRTRAAAPSDLSVVRMALDGSGAFCSLQGAFDALVKQQGSARVEIAPGTYRGIAHARGLSGLTIRGAGRDSTILAGTNNEQLNGGTSKRALISIESSRDLVLEGLTIRNETPQGGSQAEALRLEGCERCQVRDAEIVSLQDTILWSGRIYARDLLIAGNVDFVWGTGAVYFERCELKTLGRKGYMVQARNGSGYGYVFVDSKLTSDPGISGHFLARIDASVYPNSQVALIDCELGAHIDPAGFLVSAGATAGLRFGEYQSKDARGQLLDVSKRAAFVKQLSSQEAAQMRDVKTVLGGWTPQ